MVATWIELAAKGRMGGPVRAGMWSAVVLGTYPVELNQDVWLEISADDVALGPLPAYWVENKGVNSLWHVPIPPQAVGARLHYRSACRHGGSGPVYSAYQDTIVRPNLPDRTQPTEALALSPEGIVGNRLMTVRVDPRGSTYDVYYPTVGLRADVRPAEGDLTQSRSHFRTIVGGLAVGRRLDWFTERFSWDTFQHYQGATNLLMTELNWRHGPIRVFVSDFAAMGSVLPRTSGGTESPGQYIKRFRVKNEGAEPRRALFAVFIHTEVNGGVGEPGLSWHDGECTLLAINRGHSHVNRKLARNSTVEFAIALDGRGEVHCEPTGPNEALLLRWLDLPPGEPVTVDLLVSGAFTGWRGDPGTFEHWLKPALHWFRTSDLDHVEQTTALEWDAFVEPIPSIYFPSATYAVSLRRSALAAALHADAAEGAVASGFDRGLNAYCWPREALWAGCTFDRIGHPEIGRKVFTFLANVKGQDRPYAYWFQKYSIDGSPEWETPAVDQTAMIPWAVERHYRRTADAEVVTSSWPMIERAANVSCGQSGHPGLRYLDDLDLITSAGIWDHRYAAFFYSNCCVVAGLRAAVRMAEMLDKPEQAKRWGSTADRIWERGILSETSARRPEDPGLFDVDTGRFLDGRRLSALKGLWTDNPDLLVDRAGALDVSTLGVVVPFGLLPAADPRVVSSAEALLKGSSVIGEPYALARCMVDPSRPERVTALTGMHSQDVSSLATLWMARYLIRLGQETGQGRHWNRALAMLDTILGRLLPLGLSVRIAPRNSEQSVRFAMSTRAGVWNLHAMIVETMLDLAGLDYQALGRVVTLDPVLPSSWAHTGQSQVFDCGEVGYRLERPIGASVHQLNVRASLKRPVTLKIGVTCPGLLDLGVWKSVPSLPPPEFHPKSGRLTWDVALPEGDSSWSWTWG